MAFTKGQSGNPGGRPKTKPFADALRMELAALDENDPKALRGLAKKLLTLAVEGDNTLAAIKEVADRLDGKPAQAIENGEEGPFEILQRIERTIVNAPNSDS
jgi:hypothetical protein